MASDMKRIYGTNNAFEYSETIESAATIQEGEEKFIPSNVASITMGIKRTGTAKYKVQVTYSPKDEVTSGTAVWFDWDIPGVDVDGFYDEDEIQWWIPVPGSIRCVVEGAGTGTSVYFSLRAN